MTRKAFGTVKSVDIQEMSGIKYGNISIALRNGELRNLVYDAESKGEIPEIGNKVIVEHEAEGVFRIIQIEITLDLTKKFFQKELPSSIPDSNPRYNIATIGSFLILLVFGFGTLVTGFGAMSAYLWGGEAFLASGFFVILFSYGVVYQKPNTFFDEEEGIFKYDYSLILELLSTLVGAILWFLLSIAFFNYGLDIFHTTGFLFLGIICFFIALYRVFSVYGKGLEPLYATRELDNSSRTDFR